MNVRFTYEFNYLVEEIHCFIIALKDVFILFIFYISFFLFANTTHNAFKPPRRPDRMAVQSQNYANCFTFICCGCAFDFVILKGLCSDVTNI